MSVSPDYANYIKCMEEIKRRQFAIDEILAGSKSTSFKYTNVEFIALQFRKIFELIILATIASNHHFFEGLVRKIAKEWEIKKIISTVRSKNPSFYPDPVDRAPTDKPGIKDEIIRVTSGFLTLDELILAHGRIGNLMHANNPYREEGLLDEIEKQFPTWRLKLIRLLNNHLIRFPGNDAFLYVGMQSVETGGVHTSLFEKLGEASEMTIKA
jgi:hypothetical protein